MSDGRDKAEELSWVSFELPREPFISIDTQLRLYVNSDAQKLLGSRELSLGYDHLYKRLIAVPMKKGKEIMYRIRPHRLDSRGYTSARPFVKKAGFSEKDLPLRYIYLGSDYADGDRYPKGSFVFGLSMIEQEDGEDVLL